MNMETINNNENKEQTSSREKIQEIASKFSPEQQKKAWDNIVNESEKLPGELKRKIFEKIPGKHTVSNYLQKKCKEYDNQTVDGFLAYKWFTPEGQFA